jgi:hypothetical protein
VQRSERLTAGSMANQNDNRPSWKPFTEYILRWGDRRRAEGHPPTDIAPPEYWTERAKWHKEHKMNEEDIETLFDSIAEGRKSLRVAHTKPGLKLAKPL